MKFPPSHDKARISEIFSSLQGEGIHLGERHIFVRFEECHIHCKYCDELGKPAADKSLDEVVERVLQLEALEGPHRFVSFTGGEPLLYLKFLRPLMQRLREAGMRIYLETDGILGPALQEVIDLCDCVAMDMKPPSVTGERDFSREHEAFLKIALLRETFVKIVLSKEIVPDEFDGLVDVIARINPSVPLILQPVSGEIEGHEDPDLLRLMGELQRRAGAKLKEVRIMPRFHKILNIQ